MTPLLLLLALSDPWQVGPAPSAQPTTPGWSVGGAISGGLGGLSPIYGGRAGLSLTPHRRIWTNLELGYGSGWRSCVDCQALGVTWTARALAVQRPGINIAAWSVATTVNGTVEWTPGVAIEGGFRRLRFDTSWPVWSTWGLLTTLRATPEVGVSFAWSERHRTRIALVGLEPAVALSHRLRWGRGLLEATIRVGEEGAMLSLGGRFAQPFSRGG